MQISHNGIEFLKDAEGFQAKAYKDSGGVWTIGYGTTHIYGSPVEQGRECTRNEAELWLTADLATTQTALNRLIKPVIKQNMFDALVSFTYNEGVNALRDSTLLKLINQGKWAAAAGQFDRWVYVGKDVIPGLVSRRRRERSMFEA